MKTNTCEAQHMQYKTLELVSHNLCPYVQRSVITLTEKTIPHERIYIDLGNKPDWFNALSPTGKVPLLKVDGNQVLFESAVICEFLDEVTPESLHPSDPILKARHRAWNEFASQILNDIAKAYNARAAEEYDNCATTIWKKFERLEGEVALPYFAGEKFCMVDAAFGPVFRYFDVMDRYLPRDVLHSCPRVKQWRRALAARSSVKEAVSADYPELLTAFLAKRGSYISELMEMDQNSPARKAQ